MLQAQTNLVQSQNQLYTTWVSYLTARMNLYLDLELMQLDDRGVWCDEFLPRDDSPTTACPTDRQGADPPPRSRRPRRRQIGRSRRVPAALAGKLGRASPSGRVPAARRRRRRRIVFFLGRRPTSRRRPLAQGQEGSR